MNSRRLFTEFNFTIQFSFLTFLLIIAVNPVIAAPPPPLEAPSSFTASAVSSSRIDLSWSGNGAEEGFLLERSSTSVSSGYSLIASLGASVTFYANTGLEPGTTYFYRIKASGKGNKESGYSYVSASTNDDSAGSVDTFSPSISIVNPSSGAIYTTDQTIPISTSVSDNVGVTQVKFYDNGVWKSTDSSAPFTRNWSVSSSENGGHSLTAIAYDAAGNSKTSSAVNVTVDISTSGTGGNGGTIISITNPLSGANYTSEKTETITTSVSNDVTRVRFLKNGVWQFTDYTAPFSYSWNITTDDNGSNSWTAQAYNGDAYINSEAVDVFVDIGGNSQSDTTAPNVAITSPASGTTYDTATTVSINASASDDNGVAKVEFYDGATLKWSDTSAPYAYGWSITDANNGVHNWTAKAYDAAGNTKISSIVSLTVDIGGGDPEAPVVSFTNPASGKTYTSDSTVTVSASASDNIGVTKVEFYQGSTLKKSDSSSPYSYNWSFTSADNGPYTLTAKAYDAAGNVGSASINVTVDINDAPSPLGNGEHIWSTHFGGSSSDQGYAVAVNQVTGDTAMTGKYSNAVNFGDGSLPCSGSGNAVVAVYDANGSHRWSECIAGTSGTVNSQSIAFDNNGNVVVTGYFSGTISVDNQSFTSSGGTDDAFIAKYSAGGVLQWFEPLADSVNARGLGITADSQNAIVVTGFFQNPDEVFLAKYSSTGGLQWIKQFAGSGTIEGRAVATDANDNIIMTGSFYETINFGGSTLSSTQSWTTDLFVAKFNKTGTHLWSSSHGGEASESSTGVAVDNATGEIAITGYSTSVKIDFGGATLTTYGNGNKDAFIAKYAADGTHLWSEIFGGIGADLGYGVDIDESGNVILAGSFEWSVDFGGGLLTSAGSYDAYLLKYSGDGQHIWSQGLGGTAVDVIMDVAAQANGETSVIGFFNGTTDLGGDPMTSNGSYDILLGAFAP